MAEVIEQSISLLGSKLFKHNMRSIQAQAPNISLPAFDLERMDQFIQLHYSGKC